MKIIGRISKAGKEYYQTAINKEGEETEFLPVFLKKGIEKLNFIQCERKVDKRGVVYTVYEVDDKNVFKPKEEDGSIKKVIITK